MRAELERIEADFPVPIRRIEQRATEVIGVAPLEALAVEIFGESDPAAFGTTDRPLRVRRAAGRTRLEIDLPGASKEEIEVHARGDELLLRVRDARRAIALPDSLVGRPIERVRLRPPTLEIGFGDG